MNLETLRRQIRKISNEIAKENDQYDRSMSALRQAKEMYEREHTRYFRHLSDSAQRAVELGADVDNALSHVDKRKQEDRESISDDILRIETEITDITKKHNDIINELNKQLYILREKARVLLEEAKREEEVRQYSEMYEQALKENEEFDRIKAEEEARQYSEMYDQALKDNERFDMIKKKEADKKFIEDVISLGSQASREDILKAINYSSVSIIGQHILDNYPDDSEILSALLDSFKKGRLSHDNEILKKRIYDRLRNTLLKDLNIKNSRVYSNKKLLLELINYISFVNKDVLESELLMMEVINNTSDQLLNDMTVLEELRKSMNKVFIHKDDPEIKKGIDYIDSKYGLLLKKSNLQIPREKINISKFGVTKKMLDDFLKSNSTLLDNEDIIIAALETYERDLSEGKYGLNDNYNPLDYASENLKNNQEFLSKAKIIIDRINEKKSQIQVQREKQKEEARAELAAYDAESKAKSDALWAKYEEDFERDVYEGERSRLLRYANDVVKSRSSQQEARDKYLDALNSGDTSKVIDAKIDLQTSTIVRNGEEDFFKSQVEAVKNDGFISEEHRKQLLIEAYETAKMQYEELSASRKLVEQVQAMDEEVISDVENPELSGRQK
ncbi:MAG: hypothetical protein IKE75_00945 [Bacilli bacterium]|nr:hypothetical protein [Bacilli bacterium]